MSRYAAGKQSQIVVGHDRSVVVFFLLNRCCTTGASVLHVTTPLHAHRKEPRKNNGRNWMTNRKNSKAIIESIVARKTFKIRLVYRVQKESKSISFPVVCLLAVVSQITRERNRMRKTPLQSSPLTPVESFLHITLAIPRCLHTNATFPYNFNH